MKCFPRLIENLVTVLTNDIPGVQTFSKINSLRYKLLLEQSPSVVNDCRKHVWITLMSFTKWHYWIIEAFFDIQEFPRINDVSLIYKRRTIIIIINIFIFI